MHVENVKPVVIEKLEQSISTGFSVEERDWIFKYQHLNSLDATAMISRMLRNLNLEMEQYIKRGDKIPFPKLGMFHIKPGKLKAIQFRKDELAARGVERIGDLNVEDRLDVIENVQDKMREYKHKLKIDRNKPITLKIIVKKLAQ